ncbi:STAS domain-containing protein [Desulfofustis glycolicus]|uniref:Anti-sigma factor antagonist n=1 Tax=Desulfofustis glycolicus DSM 9705 TaxID=1121409 RepID=A0A1M5SMC5_9BACT|nr:STAS domain-containing protein [Desulfofustis glycolicus]SHH39590.1 anti-anti-sigma factor [Desulfofustis glycolicus DSM 9705]
MSLDIRIEKDTRNGVTRIHLGKSLDSETAPKLDKVIEDETAMPLKALILDMKDLDYISSAGIRSVMKALRVLKTNDGRLILANRQPQIVKVFEIMLSLPDLKVFANDQELDGYLDRMQAKARQ